MEAFKRGNRLKKKNGKTKFSQHFEKKISEVKGLLSTHF